MEKDQEEKIQQLQLIEQNMQNFSAQKQNAQMQLLEAESALKELEKVESGYKIIGNIMIQTDKAQLITELKSKKEISELRIKTLETSEDKLKAKAAKIKSEVLGSMKNE